MTGDEDISDKQNFIERSIAFLSPMWAYKRYMFRNGLENVRNYDAGKYDRVNSGWSPIYEHSAEVTDKPYRDIIKARSRNLERNSDIFNGIINAYVRNIVGYGLNLQVKTPDEDLNSLVSEYWDEWTKSRNCDVTGESTFDELITIVLERYLIDGGILIYKAYTEGGLLPFKLQLLEVDEIDSGRIAPKYAGNVVVSGVEKDGFGKPAGYWINEYNIDGTKSVDSRFIKKEDVIFFYKKKRPGQSREMSQMAPTISRLRDITSYMETVSIKERITASLSVFIKKTTPSGGIGGIGRGGQKVDQSSGYSGTTITPGMITELRPGEDIGVVTPSGQSSNINDYIRTQQRMAGAGQGLSYETTSRDMSQVNYSSARQGLIEDEATFKIIQKSLINHVLREIYETFFISLVVSGRLDKYLNTADLFRDKKSYLKHNWKPGARKWIDPLKEAGANRVALVTGQKSFQQLCNENGQDWKQVIDEIAQAQEYAIQKGVDIFEYKSNTK